MEDIIINDDNKLAVEIEKTGKKEKKPKKQVKFRVIKKHSFLKYLVDLFEKTIIAGSLITIDFILFTQAGSYNILKSPNVLNLEIIYILTGIWGLALLFTYILSFSKFLQNIFLSCILFVFIIAIFNQFALFDKNSMLVGIVSDYFGYENGALFSDISHYVVAGTSAFIFLIFLEVTSRITKAYFCGIMLLILGGIGSGAFFNTNNSGFRSLTNRPSIIADEADRKFVYIAMPDLTSLTHLNDLKSERPNTEAYNAKLQKAYETMLAFYFQNKYTVFPNAYVNENDDFLNIIDTFNPERVDNKDVHEATLSNVLLNSYWNFKDLYNQYYYLKDNRIYDTLLRHKYAIRAYETRGIELCTQNNTPAAVRCIKKQNMPVAMDTKSFSLVDKIKLLLAQWIESLGLVDDYSGLYNILRPFMNPETYPITGFSTKDLAIVDSIKTLDIIAQDIASDKGKNAYFAYIDMPSNLFIYDEFCQIKPMEQWQTKENMPWIYSSDKIKKREAYLDQVICLYSKLEQFMQTIRKSNNDKHTTIVLQGTSGSKGLDDTRQGDFLAQMLSNKIVNLAVYSPKQTVFVDDRICSVPSLVKGYIFKSGPCEEFENLKLTEQTSQMLAKELKSTIINEDTINKAVENFNNWYTLWAERNNTTAIAPMPVEAAQKQIKGKKNNELGGMAEKVLDQSAEAEIKSFSEALMAEEEKTSENVIKPKGDAPAPETVEPAAQNAAGTPANVEQQAPQAQETAAEPEVPTVDAAKIEDNKIPLVKIDVVSVEEEGTSEDSVAPQQPEAPITDEKASDVIPPFALDD